MNNKIVDVALLDAVFGHCARLSIEPSALSPKSFLDVVKLLADTCQRYPQWVLASKEVRRYYPICHQDCHVARIQAFVASGMEWGEDTGPNDHHRENNVVEFPTNSTKH